MVEARSPIELDREVMAMMLATNVQLVADVLQRHPAGGVSTLRLYGMRAKRRGEAAAARQGATS